MLGTLLTLSYKVASLLFLETCAKAPNCRIQLRKGSCFWLPGFQPKVLFSIAIPILGVGKSEVSRQCICGKAHDHTILIEHIFSGEGEHLNKLPRAYESPNIP